MSLPPGYELREPSPDDLDAVADVLVADDLEDAGQIVLGADVLRDVWGQPGFDLAADAWVVADGAGTIVGYGHAEREEPRVVESWGVVHPEHRGRGIGSALLDLIEERAAELLAEFPSARFRHAINAGDHVAAAMLRARGLQLVRHYWHMQIDLVAPVEAGRAPEGIEIAGVEAPDDLPAVHAVMTEAFADEWGYAPEPYDRWVERQTGNPSYDPALWLLATEGRQPVGALIARLRGPRGWVSGIGVLAPHRGRGIGEALLRRSFAVFASQGVSQVLLNVDAENITGATALYERVGMRVVKRWDLWERSSDPRSTPQT